NNNYLKKAAFAAFASAIFLTAGCGLFPEEVEHNSAAVYKTDGLEYEFTYASRGDIEKTYNVVCSYQAANKEDYSFNTSGLLYSGVYVRKGETVKAGTLLAETDTAEYKEKLAELTITRNNYEAELEYLKKEKDLLIRKREILEKIYSKEELLPEKTVSEIEAEYSVLCREYEYKLEQINKEISDTEEFIEAGRLYAGMDGVVTYAREVTSESKTSAGATVVTVSDADMAFFKASTSYKDYFSVGEMKTVVIDKNEYYASVVDPAEYGIEAGTNDVYLIAVGAANALDDGDKGTITVTLDKAENAVYVPEEAVTSFGEEYIVFYLNENGVRKYKTVETGKTINGQVEIISGVEEGERLIIG
ncbi:MAG: efflux RND transporter periplasmic adaptor subunit, partial [Lachnospiraceae bacterium]|nr:efflux RND transporter periplasmic adaptor subunit [Lachnospiraceae bacterium]